MVGRGRRVGLRHDLARLRLVGTASLASTASGTATIASGTASIASGTAAIASGTVFIASGTAALTRCGARGLARRRRRARR